MSRNSIRPNKTQAVDASIAFLFPMVRHWRRAIDVRRSPSMACMRRLSGFLAVTLFLTGCSGKQSGDLGAFVLQRATQYGARAQRTNGLPQLRAHWYFKQDADGFQVYIAGDHFIQLQSFLTATFGPPAEANGIAGRCYWADVGADLSLSREIRNAGKERVTSVVVAKRKG